MLDKNTSDREKRKRELEQRLEETGRQMMQKSTSVEFQADTLKRVRSTQANNVLQCGRVDRKVFSDHDSERKIKENN